MLEPSEALRLEVGLVEACGQIQDQRSQGHAIHRVSVDLRQSDGIARGERGSIGDEFSYLGSLIVRERNWSFAVRQARGGRIGFAASQRNADSDELIAIGTECVARWLDGHQRITIELSGGLDSSLVAGMAATLPSPPIIQGLNLIPRSPGGDERSYARSVSEKWGFGLIEASIDPSELNYLALMDRPLTVEPPVYGMDVVADGLSSDLAESCGATRILSGQGGDAVFFQPRTPLIASDYLKAKGIGLRFASLAKSCAMATNRSIWSVMRDAIRPGAELARRTLPSNVVGPATRLAWEAAPL